MQRPGCAGYQAGRDTREKRTSQREGKAPGKLQAEMTFSEVTVNVTAAISHPGPKQRASSGTVLQ